MKKDYLMPNISIVEFDNDFMDVIFPASGEIYPDANKNNTFEEEEEEEEEEDVVLPKYNVWDK